MTILLDDQNEPGPGGLLLRAGPDRVDEDGYLIGPPELVVEVATSSVSRDLHQKKAACERNRVREYIAWRVLDGEVDWFALEEGRFVRREPGPDGIIESRKFPGLRLDVPALLAGDRSRLLAALAT